MSVPIWHPVGTAFRLRDSTADLIE